MQETVQILLATYNGARFLKEQLDSLFNQTFLDFTILVRDDGSTDDTLKIITDYQQKYKGKIEILNDELGNVGATRNFAVLLEKATADYIFFCDQDDIWINNKIELSLQKIKNLEAENTNMPCLVFSDMKVIDENGKNKYNSLWQQFHLHPDFFTLNRLLIQNIPHGCTMVINKAMRNLAAPIPAAAILHDHWIALHAVSCGKWDYIQIPTVLLRNHLQNVTRKQTSFTDKLKRFSANFISKKEYNYFIKIRVEQAKALQNRVNGKIDTQQSELIKNFIQLQNTSGIERKKIFIQNNFYRTTFWHTFKMIARA